MISKFLNRILFGKHFTRVRNDIGERIETLRFMVPALRVGVLEYAPGELQTGSKELEGKTVKLYYPPEALKDKDFLKSLENAPVVLAGHNKATDEYNKNYDGWPRTVRYDESEQAAIVEGIVKGKEGAEYIRNNFNSENFGASAFLDIRGLTVKDGMTPDGQMYNAIAGQLRATHLALAPSVRDPENKIEIVNAVSINSKGEIFNDLPDEKYWHDRTLQEIALLPEEDKKGLSLWIKDWEKLPDGSTSKRSLAKSIDHRIREISNSVENSTKTGETMEMDEKTLTAIIENTVTKVLAKNAEGEELADMKTAMAKMEEAIATIKKAIGAESTERAEGGENCSTRNEDGEMKEKKEEKAAEEGATLENIKPSQTLIATFAKAFNADFGRNTPSFPTLGMLAGIDEKDPVKLITAVNAKFAELEKTTIPAQNTQSAGRSPFDGGAN